VAIGIVTARRPMATAVQLVQPSSRPPRPGARYPISWLVAINAGTRTPEAAG
jgi:hypothetical protein